MKEPSPCKTFNKKKAITCYKLRFNPERVAFDHFELFRITNETPQEYYLIPIDTLQKKSRCHFSYHKSGVFHWRVSDGQRIVPADGEADARRAGLLIQAMQHLSGQLDGYCFARGRGVSDESLDVMLSIMDGYVIPPLAFFGVPSGLKQKKNHTIPMIESGFKAEAQAIMREQARVGGATFLGFDDILKSMSGVVGETVNIIQLDPAPAKYVSYNEEVTMRLLNIGRRMVAYKFAQRGPGFWTDLISLP